MYKAIYVALAAFSSLIANDHWKGDDYAKNSDSQKASADDFMQGVKFKGDEWILDVGCGDGKITASMAESVPKGHVIGIDISPSMIQTAKSAFSTKTNLEFIVQGAAQVDYDQKFDLITSFTVMHWVLDQSETLRAFAKALKPGGKLRIQMPTALPEAMQAALEKTIETECWRNYFRDFTPPWRFYLPDEYEALLVDANFSLTSLDVATKHEYFPSRTAFHGFLKQWFPYLRPLPADQADQFLSNLLDNYLILQPAETDGRVSFIVERLEVEAANDGIE